MMNCFGALEAGKRHLTFGTLTIFKRSLNKSSVLAETHIHLGRSENGLPHETHSIPLHAHYLVACIPILLLKSIFKNLSMSFYIPLHDFRSEISIIPIFLLKKPPNFVG